MSPWTSGQRETDGLKRWKEQACPHALDRPRHAEAFCQRDCQKEVLKKPMVGLEPTTY
jgi:hypothetical protein